jgi:serine/threonine protein kinase
MADGWIDIDSTYETLRRLGEGGMGSVFLARHRHLGELRVIKVLHSNLKDNPRLRERFFREATSTRKLQHPNIAQIHDFRLTADGTPYIVMEYIDGVDVRTLLGRLGPLPVPVACEIVRQAATALAHMHQLDLVHRDISPDNIMLTRASGSHAVVKLIDLGVVKSLGEQSQTLDGQFIGKLQYASPEQFRAGSAEDSVGPHSDLYSLGIVLYELLSDREPITGSDFASIASAHLQKAPARFPDELNVPEGLQRIVFRCLEKQPAHRFAGCGELANALDQYCGKPGSLDELARCIAPSPTEERLPARPVPPARKKPRRTVIAAAALAVALSGTALTLSWRSPDPPAAKSIGAMDPGRFYAIVIGNDEHQSLPRLRTPIRDAQAIADELARDYGFRTDVLRNATRYEILSALERSVSYLTPSDNLLVFYAGHGWMDEASGTGYWQPVDAAPDNTANWISAVEIADVLGRLPARRTLIIADSCYSGAMVAQASGSAQADALTRRARLAMSSGDLQPVFDVSSSGHSFFAGAILRSMKEATSRMTARDLFQNVRAHLPAGSAPQYGALAESGHEGGEFLFIRAGSKTP